MTPPRTLWTPSPAQRQSANLTRYLAWLRREYQLDFQDYEAVWNWSVSDVNAFWESLVRYFDVRFHTPYERVRSTEPMPHTRWFVGGTLNYAEHVFRNETTERPALLFQSEWQPLTELSWAELRQQTAALVGYLRSVGVGKGDRVVGFLPNCPEATVALLATMSLGAVWSSASPDFGSGSVAERFAQVEPKVLLAVDGYAYGGKAFDKTEAVRELVAKLPTLERVVWVPYLERLNHSEHPRTSDDSEGFEKTDFETTWPNVMQTPAPDLTFTPVEFNDPVWVLYSSGTTGLPKAITHSQGGVLLEHLKYVTFHNDVRPGERFFWFTTTGWMMWNFLNASLLVGATAVLYDGSPGYPDLKVLWQLAQDTRLAHFGTSAPFLMAGRKAGLSPGTEFDLSALRSIGSTGSPLPPEGFDWVYESVKPDVWLSSMSGGTDVCTAWVGGCPTEPVVEGEIQCRCLGADLVAFDEAGQPLTNEVGELVVRQPMPSMPVFFWNDPEFAEYRASYFEEYPSVWRHGDWVTVTDRGTVVIWGRSDATLNRQGVRIGTAEIYRAVEAFPEIRDSLVVHLERPDGSEFMPLFVVLQPGINLSDGLKNRLRQRIRTEYSPRHVPDAILVAPDVPYTLSGKKLEMPVKKLLLGKPLAAVVNPGSVRNPAVLDWYAAQVGLI
jgi:acetoacetyl-CoA synthetase